MSFQALNRSPQLNMLKKSPLAYGGELLKTRNGRSQPRTLDTKNSMHMVLRSSKAKGDWSFSRNKNKHKIKGLFQKFCLRYGVKLNSVAYVGNHLHCQIQLTNRHSYRPFIRGLTSAIAMAVTGASRWNDALNGQRFWDYRPFTRVVRGYRSLLSLRDYIQINRYEGWGYMRAEAEFLVKGDRFWNSG